MKTMRSPILYLSALLIAAPTLRAEESFKYRGFSLGTSLNDVLKHSDQKLTDVKTIHARPILIQELTWWPPSSPGTSSRHDSVDQILFSFGDGVLYKMSVTYDHGSTEGLTAADMVRSISAEYGPPTRVEQEAVADLPERYRAKQNPVATWEDFQYSFNLVRSSLSGRFELLIYTKQANAEADLSIVEAVKLEERERPGREANERKKEADDLEAVRQKNQKSFHP